jgi:hypothetical protein
VTSTHYLGFLFGYALEKLFSNSPYRLTGFPVFIGGRWLYNQSGEVKNERRL